MKNVTRYGILGGTFNPIHFGHLMMGECALEQFQLDKILFMPTHFPPHKSHNIIAEDEHRKNMVQLAIEDNPDFSFSNIELEREGKTYTVDTMRILTETNPNIHYFFIIGADSLYHISEWKNPEDLLSMVTMLVASRNGKSIDEITKKIEQVQKQFGGHFELLKIPALDISSTEIRNRVKNNSSVRYYLPEKVRNYMNEFKLYRETC
ncbi:nicotinate-nucleotide adenylyltransferase [Anaeromicropila populeti]|uniref:Probable nicotinate-nucleotide adenylyltransferase n=1 Tax=Anaeromicropila populeti TaxID=37658 RepID=A0A1I6L242_9FIRM|nr:nicotinate-nucleotide adenylyltransferase [Anaeromicropila populeti]SFR97358.1 nicotinate-nucleotide adenylyltransferase [Anaeromicropila populeti]